MKWGLTEEEIRIVLHKVARESPMPSGAEYDMAIVQATLRHVYEEGEKDCPHQNVLPKRSCDRCWAELKQEAGER